MLIFRACFERHAFFRSTSPMHCAPSFLSVKSIRFLASFDSSSKFLLPYHPSACPFHTAHRLIMMITVFTPSLPLIYLRCSSFTNYYFLCMRSLFLVSPRFSTPFYFRHYTSLLASSIGFNVPSLFISITIHCHRGLNFQ